MALDVKYLRGTQAQYEAYIAANKLVNTYYYLIYPETIGEGTPVLYLGTLRLDNVAFDDSTIWASINTLNTVTIPGIVEDIEELKENAGHKFYEVTELPAFSEGHTYKEGDVCIVTITSNDIEYKTAYHCIKNAQGGFSWAAMTGNYDASNVYLDSAITLSGDYGTVYDTQDKKYYAITTIGNKKIGDTIAAGTSIQSLFSDILSKRLQPSITANPSATISATGSDGSKEVGDTYTKPTATITVKTGSYTNEGVATGVKFEVGKVVLAYGAEPDAEGAVKNSNTADLTDGGTVTLGPSSYSADATTATFTDSTVNYTFSGKAGHTAGNVAKDNLGSNSDPEIKIAENSAVTVADKTVGFRGYRRVFAGCTDVALDELTSSDIRGLDLYKENSSTNGVKASTTAFEVTAPIGATKLVIAAPTSSCGKNYTLSKAEMFTMSYEDYTGKFNKDEPLTVSVNGKGDSGNAQDYNIYYYSFTALDAPTKFKITLK